MLGEVLSCLEPPRLDCLMLDCTLGEGGHAEAFLSRHAALRYVGVDADPRIQAKARERLASFGERMQFRLGYFDEVLASPGALPGSPDLVLFDLGVSMFHFVEAGRGFSLSAEEPLDMRLSPDAPMSVAEFLASGREEEIARVIFEYGEERLSRRIARAIVEARRSGPIETASRLADIVRSAVPPSYRHGRIHPATRTFQALRIAVNDELGRARRGIALAASLLEPGGTLAVISFHSLEDRIVKNLFRELAGKLPEGAADSTRAADRPIPREGGSASFSILTKKPVEPSEEEVARNPASRSAKLRVLRKEGPATAESAAGARKDRSR